MRHRSLALVVRNRKILMIHTYRFQRYIYELPGGGIEGGETPEEAAVRELWEECGLVGTVVRPLNVLHRSNGNREYVFFVDVSADQEPMVGYDPEIEAGGEQAIKAVCWKELSELSEKDRAFLWSYGLMDVEGFREAVLGWGDEVSYPKGESI